METKIFLIIIAALSDTRFQQRTGNKYVVFLSIEQGESH